MTVNLNRAFAGARDACKHLTRPSVRVAKQPHDTPSKPRLAVRVASKLLCSVLFSGHGNTHQVASDGLLVVLVVVLVVALLVLRRILRRLALAQDAPLLQPCDEPLDREVIGPEALEPDQAVLGNTVLKHDKRRQRLDR